MKLLILMLTVILCCFSCGNEETTEEIVKPWIEHESFIWDQKYIINSVISDKFLMLKSIGQVIQIDMNNESVFYDDWVDDSLIGGAFSEKYFAVYNYDYLRIGSSVRPVSYQTAIKFNDIEESFSENKIQFLKKVGVFSGNQLLLPLKNLYLLTFEEKYPDYPDNPGPPQLVSTIKTEYNDAVYEIEAFDDFYLISGYDTTYKLDKLGNIQPVLNLRSFDFFKFNGKYFAFTENTEREGYPNLYSSENGTDWVLFASIPLDALCNFFVVNNKLYLFRLGQIAYLDFETQTYYQIDTSDIETNSITSVAEFNNKVYVSTKSGLFYKELEDFHVLKKEKTE